jgi:hypothetical protein
MPNPFYTNSTLPILFMSVSILVGCSSPQAPESQAETGYFDLAEWVEEQVEALAGQSFTLKKEVKYKNTSDMITRLGTELDSTFWLKELQLVSEANINRPALTRAYKMDSTTHRGIKEVTYQAIDPTLKTQRVTVAYKATEITQVTVETVTKNSLFSMERSIHMDLEDGVLASYILQGKQDMVTSGEETHIIKGQLVRK